MKITFDISQFLPRYMLNDRNGRAMARAIEKAFQYTAEKAEEGIDIIMNPDKMPEWRLDEVAHESGIPFDFTADIEQKREWVKQAIPMYRILGTKKSVVQYLEGYFGEIEVQESWEYDGDPFHFHVTVGGEWTPEKEAWARKAIEITKPVRSILDDFRPGTMAILALDVTGDVKYRFRYKSAGEIAAGEYPTENRLYILDETMKAAADVRDENGRVVWDFAGEKPEINHLFIPDDSGMEADAAEDVERRICYPICGDVISGE